MLEHKVLFLNIRSYIYEPQAGFEPTTYCLQGSRSTVELLRHIELIDFIYLKYLF